MLSRARVSHVLLISLVAGLLFGLPPVPAAAATSSGDHSVPVKSLASKVAPLPPMPQHKPRATAWPSAAAALIDVPAPLTRAAGSATVGGLPVSVSGVVQDADFPGARMAPVAQPAPAKVRVEVLDHAVSQRGGAPVAFKLSRADGGSGPAMVHLSVDVTAFREAFGGVYASRLQLRLVPECGLSAVPAEQARVGACAPVDVDSTVDFRNGIVSADVDLNTPLQGYAAQPLTDRQLALVGQESAEASSASVALPSGGMVVMMASSGSAQGVGTFGKTDLKESGSWQVGGNSGNFSYDYPLATPPVPGGLAPKLSLDYSSATVDGQTAAEHIQNGPLGEGWSLTGTGFIERTFRPCSLDNSTDHPATWTNATGDPCWRYDNYQLSWSGHSGELVPTGVTNVWRVADDDGTKVEYLGTLGYWRITTNDGTQLYFGMQRLPGWTTGARETASQLWEEMFANHSGEPCFHPSGYTYSHCTKTYRWMLDYVVDPHGNSMSYWYSNTNAGNLAGSNNSGQSVNWYVRDAWLERIEYGTRAGNETNATPPAKIEFTNSDRCLSNCGTETSPITANWPDVPFDLRCVAAPCNNNLTPSYWTTKRLTKITTKVWTGTGTTYKPVDDWTFGQSFPGGTDVPTLWLDSITRAGYDAAGNTMAMQPLTTHGRRDRNRADYDPNASMADPQKYRIDYLDTEAGGRINVSYLPANEPACTWWSGKTSSQWPNYNDNPYRCFEQWVTNRSGSSGWSWWHKFVVDKVTETDLVGGSPDKVTAYGYDLNDGAVSNRPLVLWGYTTSVWASPKKAMSSWKGYPSVTTTVGTTAGSQTITKRIYFRGLDRDTGLDGGQNFFRQSWVRGDDNVQIVDHFALAGQAREEIIYDGTNPVSKIFHTPGVLGGASSAGGPLPSWQTPPERYAYVTGETSTQTQTKLADGSWRTTQTDTTIDSAYGTVSQVDDKGDIGPGKTGDDVCVRNSYTRNTNDLTLRAGTGGGLVSATGSSVSVDWSRYDIIITPGDFSGDGKADLLARNTLTGNIDMYTGNGAGGFATGPVEVGWAWTDMDFAFSPGDFSGDGKPDVLYRRISDNNLYMIKGNAAGGWIDGVSIAVGWGWTDMDRLFSIGDITGDGKTDVMFRRPSTGNLYYLAGNGASSWTGAITQIGTGPWTSADRFFGKGDVTGDGKADLYTRDTATGNLSLYPGTGAGGFGTPTAAGAGWGVYQHILTTGDVTSDGKADIFARYGGARNTATASKVETVGLNCGGTVTYPTDVISDVRTSYDGDGYQVPPMRGLITKTETAKSYSGGVANAFVTTSSGYDAYGRPVWTKDPRGNQTNTLYTHDSAGLLTQVKVTNPLAHEITTNYETLRGLPTSVTDANNKVTTGSYDPLGRTTKVVKPGNTTGFGDMEYLYSITKTSAPYVQTKALGPNGNQITSFEILDGFLRPRQTQVITETGKRTVTDNRYDDRGLAAKASVFYDGASAPTSTMVWPVNGDADIDQQTRYTYDGVGRQTSNELFSHNVSQFRTTTVYQGELTGVIPPLGGTVTQSVSDARGNTVEKRQYQSPTALTGLFDATSYTYDHAGRLTGVTDAGNNTWNYSYDLLGRKYQTVDPDAGTSTSAFDDAGNVTSTTDARGRTLFYEYDALNRKTLERADTVTGVIQADWVYDSVAKGQLTSTSRYIGTNTYTSSIGSYDNGYRPLVATDSVPGFGAAGGTLAYSVTNTYKTNGALDTQQLPGVGGLPGETITHTYKATTGLPDRITSDANGGTTYVDSTNYLFDGLVSDSTFGASSGNQVKISATYDLATRRLATSSFSTKTAGTWTNDRYSDTYGFDNAGNVKSIAGTKDGVAEQEQCFTYDYLLRLHEAWTQTLGACSVQRTGADPYHRIWGFDTVGNRATQQDVDATNSDWAYAVGGTSVCSTAVKPHQLRQVTATGPKAGTATRDFCYDAAGNITKRTTETGTVQDLTWDIEGHLQTVTQSGNTVASYIYDPSGGRLIGTETSGSVVTSTLYLMDGTELAKIDGASPLGRRYYGGAVRDAAAGGLKWTINTNQGSGTFQVDAATNAISDPRRFLPYGEPRSTTPSGWIGTKGYVGGNQDGTGLTHLGAREYDPTAGRFISTDPMMDMGDPQQWNPYAYANNSPVTGSDASGLMTKVDGGGGFGGGAPAPKKKANPFKQVLTGAFKSWRKMNDAPVEMLVGTFNFASSQATAAWNGEQSWGDAFMNWEAFSSKASLEILASPVTVAVEAWDESVATYHAWQSGDWEGVGEHGFTAAADIAQTVMTVAGGAGALSKIPKMPKLPKVPKLLEEPTCPHSFDPATLVVMANGVAKPIEEIAVGDHVLAKDTETGETSQQPVTALHINQDTDLADVVVQNAHTGTKEIIHTTQHHPFWDATKGAWTEAKDLQPGTTLESPDGDHLTIAAVTSWSGLKTMRDITVAGYHTYYVLAGNTPALVHNCGTMNPADIRFSQKGVSENFKDGRSVLDLAEELMNGKDPLSVEPIRLVERNGNLYTLDNRRLVAFQIAEVPVPFRMATAREALRESWKFDTKVDGLGIMVRGLGWWGGGR